MYNNPTKSQIFTWFNKAKGCGKLEAGRVNRALGYLQSKSLNEKLNKYNTSIYKCNCYDNNLSGFICKHRICKMIIKRIDQAHKTNVASLIASTTNVVQQFNAKVAVAEYISNGYVIHWFNDDYDAKQFVNTREPGILCAPKYAKGNRVRPDYDHRTY